MGPLIQRVILRLEATKPDQNAKNAKSRVVADVGVFLFFFPKNTEEWSPDGMKSTLEC